VIAQAEYAAHNFAAARDHATQLTKLAPAKSYSYQILEDALLELGDYDQAITAFQKMEPLSPGLSISTETRLARLAVLHGKSAVAQQHFSKALVLALDLSCYYNLRHGFS
jgi:tetratricopeptide (TPR) repeat protein